MVMTFLPDSSSATMSSVLVLSGNALLAAWSTRSASSAEDRRLVVGREHAGRRAADQRAGVDADLVGAVDEHADELEVGAVDDLAQLRRARPSRSPTARRGCSRARRGAGRGQALLDARAHQLVVVLRDEVVHAPFEQRAHHGVEHVVALGEVHARATVGQPSPAGAHPRHATTAACRSRSTSPTRWARPR